MLLLSVSGLYWFCVRNYVPWNFRSREMQYRYFCQNLEVFLDYILRCEDVMLCDPLIKFGLKYGLLEQSGKLPVVQLCTCASSISSSCSAITLWLSGLNFDFYHSYKVNILWIINLCAWYSCFYGKRKFLDDESICKMLNVGLMCLASVPSAPRSLQLAVTQEDPPIVSVSWQAPKISHGNIEGYKLTYGVLGESYVEERRFDGEKYRFTTAFLGASVNFYSKIF